MRVEQAGRHPPFRRRSCPTAPLGHRVRAGVASNGMRSRGLGGNICEAIASHNKAATNHPSRTAHDRGEWKSKTTSSDMTGLDGVEWNDSILRIHHACTRLTTLLWSIVAPGHQLGTAWMRGAKTGPRTLHGGRLLLEESSGEILHGPSAGPYFLDGVRSTMRELIGRGATIALERRHGARGTGARPLWTKTSRRSSAEARRLDVLSG